MLTVHASPPARAVNTTPAARKTVSRELDVEMRCVTIGGDEQWRTAAVAPAHHRGSRFSDTFPARSRASSPGMSDGWQCSAGFYPRATADSRDQHARFAPVSTTRAAAGHRLAE